MRADSVHPQLEKPFHLIVNAHFKETLDSVDFLVLPNLAELEDLGDERHTLGSQNGTDFTEVITVVAHRTGTIHLAPAFLDAIDARDGKPKRFSSNDLTLTVQGGALEDPLGAAGTVLRTLLRIVAAGIVLLLLGLIFLKRPWKAAPPVAAPEAPVLPEPPPAPSLRDRLRADLETLELRRTRANVLAVRKTLWEHAGAAEGETLSDVLSKLANADPALHPVLRLTERAAFIQDDFLQGAIDDMIAALQRYIA